MTSYGTVQIGGKTYAEREQIFTLPITITTNLQVISAGNFALPGVADFWLKALVRDTTVAGVSTPRRFLFRLGNTDGQTWYQSGGIGGNSDRVIDTNMFGTAQFPKVFTPYFYYTANAGILYQVEDISSLTPYTIYIAFIGSYLFPVGS